MDDDTHWFGNGYDEKQVAAVWKFYSRKLSGLDRQKLEHEATDLTDWLFQSAHECMGWCGDIVDENFKAAWPLVAVALYLKQQSIIAATATRTVKSSDDRTP